MSSLYESFPREREFEYKGLTLTLRSLSSNSGDVEVDYYENDRDEEADDYVQPYWFNAWLFKAYDVRDTCEEGNSLLFVCLTRRTSDVYAFGPETWDRYYVNVKDEAEGLRIVTNDWTNGACEDQSYILVRDEYRQNVKIN